MTDTGPVSELEVLAAVSEIAIDGVEVRVRYSLTSPGCPIGPQVAAQLVEFVVALDGVERVIPELTFSPPWTPERVSEDTRFALGL